MPSVASLLNYLPVSSDTQSEGPRVWRLGERSSWAPEQLRITELDNNVMYRYLNAF